MLGAIAAIMDRSEVTARARTRTIPDGTYEAESFMDDDGIDIGKRVPIRVRVVVEGDEMTIDLTEVSQQVRGFYNSGITTGYACAQVAYKCLTSPTDYPINDGSFRSLKTIVPPGRVVSAVRPAPMRWWMTFPMTIVDTVFKALAPAIPDRVIAGHHADLLASTFHGINPQDARILHRQFRAARRRLGRQADEDGVSATVCINDGDTHNSPNEQVETKFPVVVERYALVPDSGGAGRHRGGLGVERVVRARTDMIFNSQIDRAHCKPWGSNGGREATGNEVALRIGGKWKTDFPNAKVLGRAAQARRRVPHALGRRRRLRPAAGAAGRAACARTCAGLCLGRRGGGALRRGDRSRNLRGRMAATRSCARRGAARRRARRQVGVTASSLDVMPGCRKAARLILPGGDYELRAPALRSGPAMTAVALSISATSAANSPVSSALPQRARMCSAFGVPSSGPAKRMNLSRTCARPNGRAGSPGTWVTVRSGRAVPATTVTRAAHVRG